MKKLALNSIIATLLILFATGMNATPRPMVSSAYNNDQVRSQFLKKLDIPSDDILNFDEEEAYVHFTVNSMNEIVILTTGTSNPQLDAFIKRSLNYERINAKNILLEKDYFIRVKFRKSNYSRAIL
jgi:hypothetical protein